MNSVSALPALKLAPAIRQFLEREDLPDPTRINVPKNAIILPSGETSISESAEMVFGRIAPTREIFIRGGRVVELKDNGSGIGLEIISDQAFRSKVERYGQVMAWRVGAHGETLLKADARVSIDTAKVWLESDQRNILPRIHGIAAAPVLVARNDGSIAVLPKGYDEPSGILVSGGTEPQEMSTSQAVKTLLGALEEFSFAAPSDKSRAVAMVLSPALRFGNLLSGHCPLFVVEADDSQAGKGYQVELVQTIYGEAASLITQKAGGVGGFDESLSQAMLTARPFIQFDNVRGKIGSAFFEALLTCSLGNTVPARVPHKGEIQVDPARFIFHLTSNGFESTKDLANRSCIVRIRKRRGYKFQEFSEGGLIEHVTANQGKFLGAVHAIVASWHAQGRQHTNDLRGQGRFRLWAQTLDWIVQHICGLPPLMDGHERAQERASNPALTWLRQLVLVIEQQGELGLELSASRLCEISKDQGLAIPGVAEDIEESKRNQGVGRIMGRLFSQNDTLELDDFKATKSERDEFRESGGSYRIKFYTFTRQ
jgi:hypothetical protein